MFMLQFKKWFNYLKKQKLILLLFFSFFIVLVFFFTNNISPNLGHDALFDSNNLIYPQNNQQDTSIGPLQQWQASDIDQGGQNSFVSINYNKCIPVEQCQFEDCDIEGSYDGKGSFCLPVNFSKIGNWAPNVGLDLFGISILKNPAIYDAPVEHTQASARLPDDNNNAYFMFSNSQNYAGFIWVVEVQGLNPDKPQHLDTNMPANVVWWQKLNKCRSSSECNRADNPGNFNHPARISRVENMVVIAFQNYSYTIAGKLNLPLISNGLFTTKITIPKKLETTTLPIYPSIRSADSVAFYDVSNPKAPKFIQKLVGNKAELWGGYPPGRNLSEVAIAKAGSFYHLNVSGTFFNFDDEGLDQSFSNNYQLRSLMPVQNISPLLGDVRADIFTNIIDNRLTTPMKVSLNAVPQFFNHDGQQQYGLTLQLSTAKVKYNNNPSDDTSGVTDSTFLEKNRVYSFTVLYDLFSEKDKHAILNKLKWMSEACNRAWGFQMLENGSYNVICHDINPAGSSVYASGRFVVRGVSPTNDARIAVQTDFN